MAVVLFKMEERNAGCWIRKWMFWCVFLLFSASFLPRAEGNYNALYEYTKGSQQSSVAADIEIALPSPINFYGLKYSKLQVSEDGLVGFGDSVVNYQRDPQWPSGLMDSQFDKPFIAPFHHEGYDRDPQYVGRIYYTKYKHQETVLNVNDMEKEKFLDYLGTYLAEASVFRIPSFKVDQYIMITWENVTDYNMVENRQGDQDQQCNPRTGASNPCPSATFQVVMAGNVDHTYVIFNYAKTDIPYHKDMLAGLNGGKGRGWTDVVKCDATCLKNKQQGQLLQSLPELHGTSVNDNLRPDSHNRPVGEVKGRFIFYVTIDMIFRGGCVPQSGKVGYIDNVVVWPMAVDMLGGQIIQVSGPCQEAYDPVFCRFDKKIVTQGLSYTGMTGWCPVPRLTSRGQIKLEVSHDQNSWHVYTYITVIPPEIRERVTEDPKMQPWFETRPTQLTLYWNHTELLTQQGTVDIVLVHYKEVNGRVEWQDLVKLAEKYPNSGHFQFNPQSDVRFTCQNACDDKKLGIVEIRLTEDVIQGAIKRQYITIGPLPLGWYVNRQNVLDIGDEWPQWKCEAWALEAKGSHQWLNELPPCPCTLQQALADFGRWQLDMGCNMFVNQQTKSCTFNPGAKHCVRSFHPTASGAGSHCCYDKDDNLMYSGDSYGGSMSSRAHFWGAAPFDQPGLVPSLSHWLHDLVPYHECCQWTNNEYCQLYAANRPTKDCRYYEPPGSAIVYGESHVTTFENQSYHFGGSGDYWLVKGTKLRLQARFREMEMDPSSPWKDSGTNTLRPTHVNSVAVSGANGSDTVLFTLAPTDDYLQHRIDVTVSGRHYLFFPVPMQDFKGMTVLNNHIYAYKDDKTGPDVFHSNFTVLLEGGAAVQVAERHGLLHVVVLLPPYKSEDESGTARVSQSWVSGSRGLLGTWDGNRMNEFTTPDGKIVTRGPGQTLDEATIYNSFAATWAVAHNQALFQFPFSVLVSLPRFGSLSDITDSTKTPNAAEVNGVCGVAYDRSTYNPCEWDYMVTGNRSIAENTRKAQQAFHALRQSQTKIWSCGWLPIPFATKDHVDYRAGQSVKVTGCREGLGSTGSVGSGPTQFTCVQNETDHLPYWDPYEIHRQLCTEAVESADIALIVGVSVAVFVVIVIAIVVAIILVRRKSKKAQIKKPRTTAREEAAMDPGTEETFLKGGAPEKKERNIYRMEPVKGRTSVNV